ncbi:MAG: MSMEG_1061 family FMN-dependent PPOX-type flavoprotein [Vibrio hibernica]
MSKISSQEQLNQLYPQAHPLALSKAIQELEQHSRTFIEYSPFIIISTVDNNGFIDVSPRGGQPGFVKVIDNKTIAFPDSAGNNRLDNLRNIIERPQIGILFAIPGIKEVVRLKGTASLHTESELNKICLDGDKESKVAIKIDIEECYFHCPKAIHIAKLWDIDTHIDRDFLPSLLQIIKDQKGID